MRGQGKLPCPEPWRKTRSRPRSDDTTKAILENIARRHDFGQASRQKTPAKPRRTAAAGAFTKNSWTPTRKPHAARPEAPQQTTSKSRARPPKASITATKRKTPFSSSSPIMSSSTKPDGTKSHGYQRRWNAGRNSRTPFQKLARCTGKKGSDDAF